MTDRLLENSAPRRNEFFQRQASLLRKLADHGQSPEALFICCSDARIVPQQLLGADPGGLFVLRNIANVIPPYWQIEIGVVSVLEYAVMELRVPHVIICGHTDCGGILNLDKSIDINRQPALSRWLEMARPAQLEIDGRSQMRDSAARHRAIVERHVINQLTNLLSYPFIRQAEQEGQLEIHGWVYYLGQQEVRYYDPAAEQFRSV